MAFSEYNKIAELEKEERRLAMFKQLNMKWLAGIFLSLLLIVAIVILKDKSGTKNRNRTFKSELTDFDSAKVTSILILPKMMGEKISITKEGDIWQLATKGKKYSADENAVKGMLMSLVSLKAERIAARNKDKWKEYEVTDSAATHVQVYTGKKMVCDVYLGKFSYQQPANPNPYQQQQGTLTSYVRMAGDNEVYAVEGFIAMAFNRQANDFRNHTVVRVEKENITRLSISSPEGTYSLAKQGNGWTMNGVIADSVSIANYVSQIAWLNNSSFLDEPILESNNPDYTLNIETGNSSAPIKIEAIRSDMTNVFAIKSSQNQGTYFSGKQSGLMEKIFAKKEQFLPKQ
jgi:hypothetical protein